MSSAKRSAPTGPGYAALHESLALWTDRDRVLLRVEGGRAASLLGGLLSADVAAMATGSSLLSFVLDPRGRPLAIPRVLRLDHGLVLDISRSSLPGLLDHFGVYIPPRLATVVAIEGAVRSSILGPRWLEAARQIGVDPTVEGDLQNTAVPACEGPAPLAVVRPGADGPGVDVYDWSSSAGEALTELVRDLHGCVATAEDHETWRIEQGIPLFGADVTSENLPQETGLVPRTVDFEKGCYTGQEVVARIHYRGHVNRHLRGLRWVGEESKSPPPAGFELHFGGRSAACITSSCHSPRFGTIALAYVRREVAPGDKLSRLPDGSPGWLVTELPFT